MGKRSRRDRREGQLMRAIKSGDLEALKEQCNHSSEAMIRVLRAPPADAAQAAELDVLGAQLAKRLRLSGKAADGLLVAAEGRRRTGEFRMEEALAAFALGKDEIAAAITAEDERVAAVVGPLLRAVRGEDEPAGRAKAPPERRAIQEAARAVGYAVRGEGGKARAALRRIDRSLRDRVLARELEGAVDVADRGRAVEGLDRLEKSAIARAPGDVRRAILAEAAAHGSSGIVEGLSERFPEASKEELRLAVIPAVRARLLSSTSPAAAADAIRDLDLAAFPAAGRAAAALYRGYGLLGADPEAAARSFDAALELGADMVEALRGKLLAALGVAADAAPGSRQKRASRDVGAAANRLGRALGHDASGRALVAAAETIAAGAWIDAGDARAAEASIARARAAGAAGGELQKLEAEALALRNPSAARARLDALLERDRTNVEAWRVKIDLALAQDDEQAAEAAVLEGAAATQDPEFLDEARRIRSRRGELAPFEGFVPGAVSAGALAKELARVTEEGERARGEGDDDARREARAREAACREVLGPAARLAFDAAAIAITGARGVEQEARRRLREAFGAWRAAPRDLARLAAVAILVGMEDDVASAAGGLAGDAAALTAIAEALIAAGEGPHARRLFPLFAAGLSRSEMDRLRRLAAGASFRGVEIPGVPNPDEAARELDLVLAPELSILGFLRELEEEGVAEALLGRAPHLDAPGAAERWSSSDRPAHSIAEELLRLMGAGAGALDRLPDRRRREVEQEIAEIARRPPSHRGAARLIELLLEIGRGQPSGRPATPRRAR